MRFSRQLGERLKSTQSASPIYVEEQLAVKIDAEKIATMDLDSEQDRDLILERARFVSEAPGRMPFIGFHGKYNKRWYVDIVSLPHNSVRTFLSGCFTILNAFNKLALDMTANDFQMLFVFIGEFGEYTKVVLDSEEKVLYPEVEGAIKKLGNSSQCGLSPQNRAEKKRGIYKLLHQLIPENLEDAPSVDIASSLQARLEELSRNILEYFAAKEAELPRMFRTSIRGSKEKNRMEDKLISYFEELHQEYHYTALLTVPLVSPEVRNDFVERHFYKSHRVHYFNAVTNASNSIFAIPTAFEHAAGIYEARFSMTTFLEHYGKDRDRDTLTRVV